MSSNGKFTKIRFASEVVCWLGRPDEKYQQYALDEGLMGDDVATLRQKFLSRVGPLLQEVGYNFPISYQPDSDQWTITSDLPWDRWDPKTRRLN